MSERAPRPAPDWHPGRAGVARPTPDADVTYATVKHAGSATSRRRVETPREATARRVYLEQVRGKVDPEHLPDWATPIIDEHIIATWEALGYDLQPWMEEHNRTYGKQFSKEVQLALDL